MEKSKFSSCLMGTILGAIVGLLSGMAFASGWFATGTLLVIVFFGYFLGAILDNLESLNIQIQHQRRGK
jgi:hypothetical protein